MTRYAVNCSTMFTELPLLRRPAAAADAGFAAVELWWPFPTAVPGDREVDAFVSAVQDAGVRLVALNLFAGDMASGDRGLVSWVGRSKELRDNLDVVVGIAERLGCRAFNAPYGNRVDGVTAEEQDELATRNLELATRAVERVDGTILLEPLSGAPRYPLRTADDAAAVISRVETETGADRLGLLLDVYHLAVNGDDPRAAIRRHHDRVAHVQVADAPGRGEPGTGSLDVPGCLDDLARTGYDGWVALEYVPTTSTVESLRWLPRERRSAPGTPGRRSRGSRP